MPIHQPPGPDEPLEPLFLPPGPEVEVTDRYDHADVSGLGRIRLFRVRHSPRHPMQTDEQDRASRRDTEEYFVSLSIMRAIAHRAADELGFPARCKARACRRAQRCVTDRDESDWTFPGPWMPPCAATQRLVDLVRNCIHEAYDSLKVPQR